MKNIQLKVNAEYTASKILAYIIVGCATFLTAYLHDVSVFITSLASATVLVTGKQYYDMKKEQNAN